MKYTLNRLAWLLCLCCCLLVSCDKNDDDSNGLTQLLSFGPSGVQHGEEIRFIGTHLDRVTAIRFVGATVAQNAFTSQTKEEIKLMVPTSVESGQVVLETPDGEIVSKTALNLEVILEVTGFSPATIKPGQTLTITGNNLHWTTEVRFADDVVVTEFVSKSVNELVVTVPMEAQTGELSVSVEGTEPMVVTTDYVLEVILPEVTGMNPLPAERSQSITITGTNLDLVKGVLFKGLTEPITEFSSQTETAISLTIPAAANRGAITVVTFSDLQVASTGKIYFVGDPPPLADLSYTFYDDAMRNNWQNWGWGANVKFDDDNYVREGDASIKIEYTGAWSGFKFANSSVNTSGYTEFGFAIYGGEGTNGQKLNLVANDGAAYIITLEEGKWLELKLTKADLGNPATINTLTLQNQAWTGTVYVDHVGLR